MASIAELEKQLEIARERAEAAKIAEEQAKRDKAHAAKVASARDELRELSKEANATIGREPVLPVVDYPELRMTARQALNAANQADLAGLLAELGKNDRYLEELHILQSRSLVLWRGGSIPLEVAPEVSRLESQIWRAIRHRLALLAGEIDTKSRVS